MYVVTVHGWACLVPKGDGVVSQGDSPGLAALSTSTPPVEGYKYPLTHQANIQYWNLWSQGGLIGIVLDRGHVSGARGLGLIPGDGYGTFSREFNMHSWLG